jgi:hypothetical protein
VYPRFWRQIPISPYLANLIRHSGHSIVVKIPVKLASMLLPDDL